MLNKSIIWVGLFLVLFIGCQYKSNASRKIVKCTIFPTGVYYKTYLVEIYDDGKFEITFGEINANARSIIFVKKSEYKSIIIKQTDLKELRDLRKQLLFHNSFEKTTVKKGGWEIILNADGKKFNFYYGEMPNTPFGKIVAKIIKIAPLKIDIHSWS